MFGYDGGFIARVCNAFPSIHAELEKVTAERDQWKQMYADLSEVHKCHNCDYEYIQTKKYKSFQYRQGELILNSTERILMEILMKFGESVDSQGYDGGDYDTAMKLLLFLYETHAVDCPNYKITKKEVFNVPRGEGSWKCNCGTWNDPYSDRCRECKEFLRTINEKNCGGSCYAMSVPSSFL